MRGATTTDAQVRMREEHFNSHAPCGAQLSAIELVEPDDPDFNSHAPCGAQPWYIQPELTFFDISTHTPHAGRNHDCGRLDEGFFISTHTPHAGRNILFSVEKSPRIWDFNSHAPCGAQHTRKNGLFSYLIIISTHTPHAGRNF